MAEPEKLPHRNMELMVFHGGKFNTKESVFAHTETRDGQQYLNFRVNGSNEAYSIGTNGRFASGEGITTPHDPKQQQRALETASAILRNPNFTQGEEQLGGFSKDASHTMFANVATALKAFPPRLQLR